MFLPVEVTASGAARDVGGRIGDSRARVAERVDGTRTHRHRSSLLRATAHVTGARMPQGVTFSAIHRCSGVRLSPKSIFLGIVALGLPLAVTAGWMLGGHQDPPSTPSPGGAGGIGTAPDSGTSIAPLADEWSPTPARPVAVQTRVPVGRPRGGVPARPSATSRDLPDPTMTARPAPEPTEVTAEPTLPPTVLPTSVEAPSIP
jgi:hypothetical protein